MIQEDTPSHQPSLNKSSQYLSWAERNGFADWVLALFWIIVAFFLFQFTAFVVAIGVIVSQGALPTDPAAIPTLMTQNLDMVFWGNSSGQILFLGLATWFFARLHVSLKQRKSFLRFRMRSNTATNMGLAFLLVLVAQPVIWFLAWLNAFIPVPDYFTTMQNSQMEMIENYLRGDHLMWLTLFHVALVPAICEETLYRGYVMSAFQKSWGIWTAIIFSGLLFGLYHVQLSNLIPLATLGMLFAYITWISRSIYPAMMAHFVNNAGSVLVAKYYPDSAFAEITPEAMPPLWSVIPSLLIAAIIVYYMYNRASQNQGFWSRSKPQ